MKIDQRFPKLDPHGFLERAFFWLDSGIDIGIFYAALELRFAFEKILIKHGFASTNYSKSFEHLKWQPAKLRENLSKEFSHLIDLDLAYKFSLGTSENGVTIGYYLPVGQDLFSLYGRLDNYLHAQWAIPIGVPNNAWQREHSQSLRDFAERLIPHANPINSLDLLSIPNINLEKSEIGNTEAILRKYWEQ